MSESVSKMKAQGVRELADMWEASIEEFAYCVTDDERAETAAWVKAARLFADLLDPEPPSSAPDDTGSGKTPAKPDGS